MRIGVLTGGGDCPGLNAVIRAVVRKGVKAYGYEFIGFRDGWRGPLEGLTMKLDIPATRGILPRGGTILGSSRTNPFKIDGGVEKIKENLAKTGVDALRENSQITTPISFTLLKQMLQLLQLFRTNSKDIMVLMVKGFLLNLANPMVIFYWFSIMTLANSYVESSSSNYPIFYFLTVIIITFFSTFYFCR